MHVLRLYAVGLFGCTPIGQGRETPPMLTAPHHRQLDFLEKCVKNCKEQPFVPLGTLATTVAVILAAKALRQGNRPGAQKWFRYRVGLQGFTIAALVVGGIVYGRDTQETRKTKDEQLKDKAKMREKLWIEELERRDTEAKQRKQRAEFARQKHMEAQAAEAEAEAKTS